MGKGHHSCGVSVCPNTSVNARKRGLVIHFFRFPQDPDVRKDWIVKCNRADKSFNPNNARICSDHFTLDDYEDSLKARLMDKTPIKLKKDAVPTLLLHVSKSRKQPRRKTKQIGRKKLKETNSQLLVDENFSQELSPIAEAPSNSPHLNGKIKFLEEEVTDPNRKIKEKESLKQRIETLIKENEELNKRFSPKPDNAFKSPSSKNVLINEESLDMELERRVSQFIASKVQILVAELL